MLQQLFGAELDFSVRLAISLIVIAALLGATVLVLRRLGALPGRGGSATRGRPGPRLAIVDAIAIDQRRRLVLVRRDDVEHLLLTGGSNDVVVEPNITGGYVTTAGLRPALPLEREAPPGGQPAVGGPAAAPALGQRPDTASLPPAPQSPEVAAPAAARPAEPRRLATAAQEQISAFARAMPRLGQPRPTLEPQNPPPGGFAADEGRTAPEIAIPAQTGALTAADEAPSASPEPVIADFRATPASPVTGATTGEEAEREPPEVAEDETEAGASGAAVATRSPVERRPARRPLLRETRLKSIPTRQAASQSDEAAEDEAPAPRPAPAAPSKAAAYFANAQRRKAQAAALQRRLPTLPESEQAATRNSINRLNEQVQRLLKEGNRVAAIEAAGEAAATAATASVAMVAAAAAEAPVVAASPETFESQETSESRETTAPSITTEAPTEALAMSAEPAKVEAPAVEVPEVETREVEALVVDESAESESLEQPKPAAAESTPAVPEAATPETAAPEIGPEAAPEAAPLEAAAEAIESIEDQIAAAFKPAATVVEPAPSPAALRPAARLEPTENEPLGQPALEPRLKDIAQRLDAALSQPAENKLHLSLSDLLEDIEGAAAEVNAAPPPERPRVTMPPRPPVDTPRVEPAPRPSFGGLRSRFAAPEPAATNPRTEPGEEPASRPLFGTRAEPYGEARSRATPRFERMDEPAPRPYRPSESYRPADTYRSADPLRSGSGEATRPLEPAPPRPREPFLSARRGEPGPLHPLPRTESDAAGARFEPKVDPKFDPRFAPRPEARDEAEKPADPLDDFDAEMANLLGRTPSR